MRTVIHRGPPEKLTPEERKACRRATLGADGSMRYDLDECLDDDPFFKGYTFRLKNKENGYLIGWALVTWADDDLPTAQFYIKSKFRKKGYGTRLANLVKAKFGEVSSYGWDPRARSFFRKNLIAFVEP